MPLTIADISRLKILSTANFRKLICKSCGEDYYTTRENSKYCGNACRQMGYRKRVLDFETVEKQPEPQIDPILETEIKIEPTKNLVSLNAETNEIEEKLKKYSINLIHLKNGK
ncbi:MAG TPA: hypothetical protein VN026_08495 [Bacteroidia bacterium]|jgi:hypothetical protein|nr:hypothetical protein [Bacteroidia bacterium]